MKHWQEMAHILDRVARLGREGRSAALAVVTHIHGSAYRRPGAKLLVDSDGTSLGSVSGGCLEEDVREIGLEVLKGGHTRALHYDTGTDETKVWGLGLGCDGEVDLLVQPIDAAQVSAGTGIWGRAKQMLAGDAAFAIATVVEDDPGAGKGRGRLAGTLVVGPEGRLAGELADRALEKDVVAEAAAALAGGRSRLRVVGGRQVFTDVLLPPPKLLVCGAGDDALPTASFAAIVGFRVFVADHRPAFLTAQRFPDAQRLFLMRPEDPEPGLPSDQDTFAVLKTHSFSRDKAWIARLLSTDIPYIGVLGPRKRIGRVLTELGLSGSKRVFGPVGIDIGADGPEQVALSIVGELLAVRSHRTPSHLRDRAEAIHD